MYIYKGENKQLFFLKIYSDGEDGKRLLKSQQFLGTPWDKSAADVL